MEPVWRLLPIGAAGHRFTKSRSRVEHPRRLTHKGNYNARPRYSSDGKLLAIVHGDGGSYRIGTYDMETERLAILTNTRLDEFSEFRPQRQHDRLYDGRAARDRAGGHLDRWPSEATPGIVARGEVREPAWGPFRY